MEVVGGTIMGILGTAFCVLLVSITVVMGVYLYRDIMDDRQSRIECYKQGGETKVVFAGVIGDGVLACEKDDEMLFVFE